MPSKGSVLDLGYVTLVIFIAAIVLLFAFTLLGNINAGLSDVEAIDTSENSTGNHTMEQADRALVALDSMLPVVFISLGLASVALAFMVPNSPVFAVFSFITLTVLAFITTVYSNVFVSMGQTEALGDAAIRMSFSSFVMENMLLLTVVFGVLTLVAMYVSGGGAR